MCHKICWPLWLTSPEAHSKNKRGVFVWRKGGIYFVLTLHQAKHGFATSRNRKSPITGYLPVDATSAPSKKESLSFRVVTYRDRKETSEHYFEDEVLEELLVGNMAKKDPDWDLELSESVQDSTRRRTGLAIASFDCIEIGAVYELFRAAPFSYRNEFTFCLEYKTFSTSGT